MASLREKLKRLPAKPGVYFFKDKQGTIIYVGKAKSLRRRVASYFKPHPDLKTSLLLERLCDIDFQVAESELAALLQEKELIKQYQPRYNIIQKDDKAYPLLKLTVNEPWPRLLMVRRREADGAHYFGRYQGAMVKAVLRLVKKLWPIRWCKESPLKKREQPCLYYRIGQCAGPCVAKISPADYRSMIKGIELLLQGDMQKAFGTLQAEMAKASAEQDYERAAYYRDSLKLLEKMLEGKPDLAHVPASRTQRELAELQSVLQLKSLPQRIEAFDISNIQGSNIVASLVTFFGGVPLKKDYRRFKINTVKGKPDDVRALREVLTRRYTASLAQQLPLPDLIMVDGGLAQVNFGQQALVMAGLQRPIIGLAKKEEEIYFPGCSRPLRLAKNLAALQLLQRIRDEAHRFALAYHRARRQKALFR